MKRRAENDLGGWLQGKGRKPLVLRGARQVGKTWLVRALAEAHGLDLIEINFEWDPSAKAIFASNDPSKYLSLLELARGREIDPEKSLLFLDEVQAFPDMLAKLRWLYEKLPSLAVIAAGSLLDFTLADHSFSMPVGRIGYYYLEPFGFNEFLKASGNERLAGFMDEISLEQIKAGGAINPAIHSKLIELFKIYSLVGGMPEALSKWIETGSYLAVSEVQQNLLMTYRDDFSKYAGRSNREALDEVFVAIPRCLGAVIKYSHLSSGCRTEVVKRAFDLLVTARVCHRVPAASAEGIPISATVNRKKFKALFVDVGLVSASLGLQMSPGLQAGDFVLANRGAIAEQAIGQLLRTVGPYYMDPTLHYWARDKRGAEAEVDYLIQCGQTVVPIEIKAGTTGSLKSLHSLMSSKQLGFAIRMNTDLPSWVHVGHGLSDGRMTDYNLLSLPCYMTEQTPRLASIATGKSGTS
jgi:predicted AAA+ superfamily ATPase